MPAMPAARLGDMHVCPMVTPGTPPIPHVGGPILPACAPTVIIGGMPAARIGDMALCVGPTDAIVQGSATVITAGKPQSRIADQCAHGGKIVAGCPTVIVGDAGGGGGGGGGGAGRTASGSMSEWHGRASIAQGPGGGTATDPDEREGRASIAAADAAKMARSLVAAAKHGTPFCEICFRTAVARGETREAAMRIARDAARDDAAEDDRAGDGRAGGGWTEGSWAEEDERD